MKEKAIVIGRSNGIDLAIAHNLIACGYQVIIVDRIRPDNTGEKYHV